MLVSGRRVGKLFIIKYSIKGLTIATINRAIDELYLSLINSVASRDILSFEARRFLDIAINYAACRHLQVNTLTQPPLVKSN